MGRDIGDDSLPYLARLRVEGVLQGRFQEMVTAYIRKLIVSYLLFSSSPYLNLHDKMHRTFIYSVHTL